MGYLHIDNLYKAQDVLLFKECYALEKVHGSSAWVGWRGGQVHFHVGGQKHERFVALFDTERLTAGFKALGYTNVIVYGEAHGAMPGQKMQHVYGKGLYFTVFDVQVRDVWLAVPDMADVAKTLGLEVVPFERGPTTLEWLDAQRDAPSALAQRRGMGVQQREGVVLRPPIEVVKNNGGRIIAKYKGEGWEERVNTPRVSSPEQLRVLSAADAVAQEWMVPTRMAHIVGKMTWPLMMKDTSAVVAAAIEDVLREATGEIVDSKEVRRAIGRRAAEIFHQWLKGRTEV